MRRVPESEIESDFERQYAWGDDERNYYCANRRKSSVMGGFLRLETVLDLVEKYSPGKRVADFASAQGNFGLLLAERGFDVLALDINEEFLKYACKKYTHGKFRTQQANIMEYTDPEGFDCILLGEVIEHVAFPDQLLTAAFRNLRPGGIVIVTTPNGAEYGQSLPTYSQVTNVEELIPKQFHWGDHLFLYTDEELASLMRRVGFTPIQTVKLHSSYVSQIKGARYLMPMSLLRWLERKTRTWKKGGKDSTNSLVMVGRKG